MTINSSDKKTKISVSYKSQVKAIQSSKKTLENYLSNTPR